MIFKKYFSQINLTRALILITGLFLLYFPGLAESDELESFSKSSDAYIGKFASSAKYCIQRHDTSHPVFHGCIDWHSAVHGHWSILRAYRMNQDPQLRSIVLSSIKLDVMQQEHAFLKKNPTFEMPYGRAWFLKLMVEYELVTGSDQFRFISDDVANSLFKYLNKRSFDPAIREYQNQSWAYANLIQYYAHVEAQDKIKTLKEAAKKKIGINVKLDVDHKNADFFSLWGNLAYLNSLILTDEEFKNWLNQQSISVGHLKPVLSVNSDHHLSINYSRAWGFWSVYRKTGLKKYKHAYIEATKRGLSLHQRYEHNYHAYGHWVPQFGMLALTISKY